MGSIGTTIVPLVVGIGFQATRSYEVAFGILQPARSWCPLHDPRSRPFRAATLGACASRRTRVALWDRTSRVMKHPLAPTLAYLRHPNVAAAGGGSASIPGLSCQPRPSQTRALITA